MNVSRISDYVVVLYSNLVGVNLYIEIECFLEVGVWGEGMLRKEGVLSIGFNN